jgi:hypothetical protein
VPLAKRYPPFDEPVSARPLCALLVDLGVPAANWAGGQLELAARRPGSATADLLSCWALRLNRQQLRRAPGTSASCHHVRRGMLLAI